MSPEWNFSKAYYERSLNTLDTALKGCSAYRAWREFDPGPGFPVDARYAALPWLTKTDIRAHFPDGFVPPECNLKQALDSGEIWFVTTSGTMDLAVTNIWNPAWWFASERASWKLNSHLEKICTPGHTEAILANPINVGFKSDEGNLPPEQRRWGNYLYLNEKTTPLLWTPPLMERMVNELAEFRPDVLEANPSLLAKLCRYVTSKGYTVFQPKAIVLTYEYTTFFHLQQFRKVFSCPTVSSYGSTELGYVFEECECGKLHQNTEFCRVDLQPLAPSQGEPDVFRILTTTFDNPCYYLIRFDVSDLVRIDSSGKCPCGRDDGIILSDIEGRAPFMLDKAMSILENIDEYRLDQDTPTDYLLRLVSERPDKDALTREAISVLKNLYGAAANVTVMYEKAITPETSGKYRLSRANYPIEIENFLDPRFLGRTT
jgi:hypothetical protein